MHAVGMQLVGGTGVCVRGTCGIEEMSRCMQMADMVCWAVYIMVMLLCRSYIGDYVSPSIYERAWMYCMWVWCMYVGTVCTGDILVVL